MVDTSELVNTHVTSRHVTSWLKGAQSEDVGSEACSGLGRWPFVSPQLRLRPQEAQLAPAPESSGDPALY